MTKALLNALNELSIVHSAFRDSQAIAAEIARLQSVLASKIAGEIEALEEEGLTEREKARLYPALLEEFVLTGADLADVLPVVKKKRVTK